MIHEKNYLTLFNSRMMFAEIVTSEKWEPAPQVPQVA
jgi:hypothetical protein